VLVRAVAGRRLHHALPMTAAMAVAVAGTLPGSVVAQLGSPMASGAPVRVGHPSGVSTVRPDVARDADAWTFRGAELELTARRLMSGVVHLPRR
jgi:2-methylaconitate cis-trans-isomerase PrpF